MINWYLDKESKIPLYLQLKDQIKYHISTGNLVEGQKLPSVNAMAADLGINFETVRKSYKELEKEGLITMKRARGTLVTLQKEASPSGSNSAAIHSSPELMIRNAVSQMMGMGKKPEEIRRTFNKTLKTTLAELEEKFIIFTECNLHQVTVISKLLKDYLGIRIKPVLLQELKAYLQKLGKSERHLRAIVTTGFHVNDVRTAIENKNIEVFILITNMSPETRRKIDELGLEGRYGFICRDRDSIPLYKDLLRSEFGEQINLTCTHFDTTDQVDEILRTVDVLLATPPVYEELKNRAADKPTVINVFDRIEPM